MVKDLERLLVAYGGSHKPRVWGLYDLFDHLKVGFPGLQEIDRFGADQSLLYSMHGWRIGSLGFVAGEHSALQARGGYDASGMSINFLFDGQQTYQQLDLIHALPFEGAVLLNDQPAWVRASQTNSLGIFFDPLRVVRTSEVMCSSPQVTIDLRPRYITFKPFQVRYVRQLPNLLASLRSYPKDAEDTVYRFLARLFITGEESVQKSTLRQELRKESIDRACAFMRERIGDDITLTEIEEVSGLSSRLLQLGFKERFGCGPKVWLTRLRLELAHGVLVRSGNMLSIAEVASNHGFRHQGRFSILFRSRFGYLPSRARGQGPSRGVKR